MKHTISPKNPALIPGKHITRTGNPASAPPSCQYLRVRNAIVYIFGMNTAFHRRLPSIFCLHWPKKFGNLDLKLPKKVQTSWSQLGRLVQGHRAIACVSIIRIYRRRLYPPFRVHDTELAPLCATEAGCSCPDKKENLFAAWRPVSPHIGLQNAAFWHVLCSHIHMYMSTVYVYLWENWVGILTGMCLYSGQSNRLIFIELGVGESAVEIVENVCELIYQTNLPIRLLQMAFL